ncbi:MAG: hypothetical protein HC877_19400 [Thioploca sp.]|nr:hypothetical protein [Thioploca sp.]
MATKEYIVIDVGKEYGSFKVEVEPIEKDFSGTEELGLRETVQETTQAVKRLNFNEISNTICAIVGGIKAVMRETQPDQVSVEFSIAIKADTSVVVAQAGAEAQFSITLTWGTKLQ